MKKRIMHWLWILKCIIWILVVDFVSHGQSETIDEIIAGAVEDAHAMDFIQEDGTVLVEMDMKFKADDWAIIQGMKDADIEINGRKKRKAIRWESKRWTKKVVPYFLSNVFSEHDVAQIMAAIVEWEKHTCLTFRPKRTKETNYILFQNGGGCSSFVGMQGGAQSISLARGCRTKGVIVHEIGHAIGFQHEQTRPDRDNYVTIYNQNIIGGKEHNFQKYSNTSVNTFGVPYDYASVMHYGGKFFSSNGGYTIRTIDRTKQHVIGNRNGLSIRDIELANIMYQCTGNMSSLQSEILVLKQRIYVLESLLNTTTCISNASNCADLYKLGHRDDGEYTFDQGGESYQLYCDMTQDGGGWTVIQRRFDGSVDFYRNWDSYKTGFGNLTTEFWLGNDLISLLTKHKKFDLHIALEDFSRGQRYAEYSDFQLGDEEEKYTLNIGSYSGDAGDALTPTQKGRKFSTHDNDNDGWSGGNCASVYEGGFWFYYCGRARLNGRYSATSSTAKGRGHGLVWRHWKGYGYSLKKTCIKIRPMNF